MAVYVDDVAIQYGRMKMCHCWADTEDELFDMMRKIGVQLKWVQRPPKASWLHFDICITKKQLAILSGAILMDRFAPLHHTSLLAGRSAMVEEIRAMRLRKNMPLDGRVR